MRKFIFFATTIFILFYSTALAQLEQALFFDELEYDFGIIQEDSGMVTHHFVFTNETGQPIQLKEVNVTCGCTSPFWDTQPINPSEQGKIEIQYNPKGRPGGFNKNIVVVTQTDEVYQLKIKGYVEPKVKSVTNDYPYEMSDLLWSTKALNFGRVKISLEEHNVPSHKKRVELVKVYNPTDSAINVTIASPKHLLVSEDSFSLKAKEHIRLEVKFEPDSSNSMELGYRSDNVQFRISETGESVAISTFASVEEYFPTITPEVRRSAPKLRLNEKSMDIGEIKKEEVQEVQFFITNTGKSPLSIRALKSNCKCLQASLEESLIQANDSTTLSVKFFPGQREGIQHKSITLFSNDPVNPTQLVTIRARVKGE